MLPSKPTKEHWVTAKCILRYLKSTINYGLMYSNDGENDKTITGYSDADWAGVMVMIKNLPLATCLW